ncbi:MAG: hypothetical protein DRP00_05790 [Candidatus Aenigmatarchaeota archaeon]|nr:MAG: hypothetical protein DRP00_05790 [Candidatus Aenigmarchaeota archaeon]
MVKKFYEEFSRKTTPEHDKLLLQCVSEQGLKKIIETIYPENTFEKIQYYETFYLCGARKGCRKEGRVVTNFPKRFGISYCEDCVYYDKKSAEKWQKPEEIGKFNVHLIYQITERKCRWFKTEVICKTGRDFIVGYADLLILYELIGDCIGVKSDVPEENAPREIYGPESNNEEILVLVEVKPKLDSLGTVIRQIKTYYDCLKETEYRRFHSEGRFKKAVVTYSDFSKDIYNLFLNEGIYLIKFPKQEQSSNKTLDSLIP